jgi:DNA invertase Pin-like site-specific DNA recombinase
VYEHPLGKAYTNVRREGMPYMIHTETQTPIRAVGYIRVSTDGQGERGYGLDAQTEMIHAEAARRGWTVEHIYVDVASGRSTRKRPQYREMLRALGAGQAEVLIVAKLDRLSRSLVDFAQVMATAQKEKWSINALDIGIDTSSINGELIAHIIMALAQWERRIIGERTTTALSQVRSRGTKLGRPSNVENDTLRLIRILRESGKSWQAVANALAGEGVPTAQGGQWRASTVRKLYLRG